MKKRIRILIVDDHFAVRKGLSASINTQPDMQMVAEAANGAQALEQYQLHQPDVVLMDLRMPGQTGQQVVAALCSQHPEARVIVFSSFSSEEEVYTAVQAGARSFLTKTSSWEELAGAIRTVHRGEKYFPLPVAAQLASRLAQAALSGRELEVLRWVARGESNKEIGTRLGVTEMTVKIHLHHILRKFPANDRTQAVMVALQRGLLLLDS